MHRFGWLLVGFAVILLLGRGFFLLPLLLLPFVIWPLMAIFFRGFAHGAGGRGAWGHGPRRYNWRGRQGYYYDEPRRFGGHGCGARAGGPAGEPEADEPREPRANTGETTRL